MRFTKNTDSAKDEELREETQAAWARCLTDLRRYELLQDWQRKDVVLVDDTLPDLKRASLMTFALGNITSYYFYLL